MNDQEGHSQRCKMVEYDKVPEIYDGNKNCNNLDDSKLKITPVMFDWPVGWQKVLFHQSVDCKSSGQDS